MVPWREKPLEGYDPGNEHYLRCMKLLKAACVPFYEVTEGKPRECKCGCTNQERVGDHLEAVIGVAICLSGTQFEEVKEQYKELIGDE